MNVSAYRIPWTVSMPFCLYMAVQVYGIYFSFCMLTQNVIAWKKTLHLFSWSKRGVRLEISIQHKFYIPLHCINVRGSVILHNIEWFIEGQAFSWSYDLVPRPPPPPSCPVSKLDRRHTGKLKKRDNLLTGEGGEGVGEEPNHRPQESLVLYNPFNTLCKHAPVLLLLLFNKIKEEVLFLCGLPDTLYLVCSPLCQLSQVLCTHHQSAQQRRLRFF